MKSIFFSILFVSVAFTSFSQEATVEKKATLIQSIKDGVISITLPNTVTAEDVTNYSKYYTPYFTTAFEASTSKVSFTMVNNDAKSRRVIMRFLGANKIQTVLVEDRVFPVTEFYNTFLK